MFSSAGTFFVPACICDMMAALTVTHFCCDIIQHDGFGEGTGFLLLALTLSGAVLVRCSVKLSDKIVLCGRVREKIVAIVRSIDEQSGLLVEDSSHSWDLRFYSRRLLRVQ